MPVSKRRKPKHHLPPNAMPKYQARAHFRQLAQMDGTTYDLTDRIVSPSSDAGDNAFANAWDYAYAHDLAYAEGVVWTDATGWTAHAWCVANESTVVEVTAGFEDATAYKGWVLVRKDAELMNGGTDTPRESVLATGLASGGGQWDSLAGRITKREPTSTTGPATKSTATARG